MKKTILQLLTKNDLLKGAAVAFLGVFLQSMENIVSTEALPSGDQLLHALIIGLKFAGAYLLKNAIANYRQIQIPNQKPNDEN